MLGLFASCIAALVARFIVHPLDTLKTRLQTESTSFHELLHRISVQDGLLALYNGKLINAGLFITLLFSVPGLATWLAAYDVAMARFQSFGLEMNVFTAGFSAIIAEMLSALWWTPMEIIKARQQVQHGETHSKGYTWRHANGYLYQVSTTEEECVSDSSFSSRASLVGTVSSGDLNRKSPKISDSPAHPKSAWECAVFIYENEGFQGFFYGYWLSLAVFIPFSMVYFITYENLKLAAYAYYQTKQVNLGVIACASGLAAALAAFVSNGFDVVKTQWQVQLHDGSTSVSILDLIWEQGSTLLVRSVLARVLWAVPNSVISFTVFEYLKDQL